MTNTEFTYSIVEADEVWQEDGKDTVWALTDGTSAVPVGTDREDAEELARCYNDGTETRESFEEVAKDAEGMTALFKLFKSGGVQIGQIG